MSPTDIAELTIDFLSNIGGVGVIIIGLCAYIGKLSADRIVGKQVAQFASELERLKTDFLRETETHKVKLKKSEILFKMEIDAASTFVYLFRGLQPINEWPNMDSNDAHSLVAAKFPEIEIKLLDFLSRHGSVLESDVVDGILMCASIAGAEKFNITDIEVPNDVVSCAHKIFSEMRMVEHKMLARIRNQTVA